MTMPPVRRRTFLGLAGAIALARPAFAAPAGSEDARLRTLLDRVYRELIENSPFAAATAGSPVGRDRWDDMSAAGQEATARRAAGYLAELKAIDYDRLSPAARIQYRAFESDEQIILERHRWRDHLYPLNQIVGLHIDVPNVLINQHPVTSVADAEAYIRRLEIAPQAFDALIARMKGQAARGFYMPSSTYPLLLEGARQVLTGQPFGGSEDSPLWEDIQRKVNALPIAADAKAGLLARARTALAGPFRDGYERLIALLEAQQKKATRDDGVWSLPDGDRFYAFLIRQFTTTDMTPEQIHQLGLSEVERIHGEMRRIMDRVGYSGTLQQFMAHLKEDSRFYFPDTDEGRAAYLKRAQDLVAAMQAKLPTMFMAGAPLPLVVRRAELYREASLPAGYYDAGSPDGSRPGYIYLNLSDMKSMPTFDLDALLYHEGVPGHHMQISTILVDKGVPELRKINDWWQNTAFVEGWGLYAEALAKDMGFYQDPYADFGRLAGELWRACRLVLDSGLHYKRWSRQQAIRYLNDNTASSEKANSMAVDRYLAVPGQATAFTVGMHAFQDERERARKAMGARFDVRGYHDVVLRNGFVPLSAVRQAVDDWIRSGGAAWPRSLRDDECRADETSQDLPFAADGCIAAVAGRRPGPVGRRPRQGPAAARGAMARQERGADRQTR